MGTNKKEIHLAESHSVLDWQLPTNAFTMKLFQSVGEYYRMMGIYPLHPDQNCSINLRNAAFSMSFFLLFASTMGHFLFESTELINRSEALYVSLTVLACVNNFIITTWKMENFRMLIERLEKFIENSKFVEWVFVSWPKNEGIFGLFGKNRIKCRFQT